ncbi:MAG TPA: alpha/beta hydrolase [Acidobacteriota bacterium]|nr:alpha/beta hydrolase [Acidobacteriota bacterium]
MKNKIAFIAVFALIASVLTLAGKETGPWKDKYIQVGDIKIHYLEAGSGDRVLVFIPGWMTPAEIWKEQIPYFSSRGFRVIAMDPRSQGETTRTEVGNTYQQHAADLHAFLQTLKVEHCYLVGWAAGVTTLLEYLSSPESLMPDKVVFVEGGPAIVKTEDYPGSTTPQQARKLLLAFQEDRTKAIDQYIRGLFKSGKPEILLKELLDGSQKTSTGAAVTLYFDLFTGDRRSALRHVSVPTLVMTTSENRANGEYLKAKIARSTLEVVEDAGNAIFLDKPQAFNQTVEAFLGEH